MADGLQPSSPFQALVWLSTISPLGTCTTRATPPGHDLAFGGDGNGELAIAEQGTAWHIGARQRGHDGTGAFDAVRQRIQRRPP